jgi:hypothetical protein
MNNVKRLGGVAVALLMVTALAAPTLAATDITVGEFLQEFAKAKNLNATDPRIAADSLAAVGIQVPADVRLSERLTENVVIKVSRSAGLNLSTSRPDAGFSAEQVDRFFATFSGEFRADAAIGVRSDCTPPSQGCNGNGPPFDPFSKGKGKHKGHGKGHRSPTDPD